MSHEYVPHLQLQQTVIASADGHRHGRQAPLPDAYRGAGSDPHLDVEEGLVGTSRWAQQVKTEAETVIVAPCHEAVPFATSVQLRTLN